MIKTENDVKLLLFLCKAFHWLTGHEHFSLVNGPLFKKEDLSSDEIKELLQIVDQEEQK